MSSNQGSNPPNIHLERRAALRQYRSVRHDINSIACAIEMVLDDLPKDVQDVVKDKAGIPVPRKLDFGSSNQ